MGSDRFEIAYAINTVEEQRIAKAVTRHVCINAMNRTKQSLPGEIMQWFQQWV
jgi:1,4-dihydroxy-2-naphthoyl-CoA hydrolase